MDGIEVTTSVSYCIFCRQNRTIRQTISTHRSKDGTIFVTDSDCEACGRSVGKSIGTSDGVDLNQYRPFLHYDTPKKN